MLQYIARISCLCQLKLQAPDSLPARYYQLYPAWLNIHWTQLCSSHLSISMMARSLLPCWEPFWIILMPMTAEPDLLIWMDVVQNSLLHFSPVSTNVKWWAFWNVLLIYIGLICTKTIYFLQSLQTTLSCLFPQKNNFSKTGVLLCIMTLKKKKEVYQSHKVFFFFKVHSSKDTKLCSRYLWILTMPTPVQRQQQHVFNQNTL